MNDKDAERLAWLRDNPSKTYNDLPQSLWDDSRIASEVARQNNKWNDLTAPIKDSLK